MEEEVFKNLGFTDGEIKVYKALLELQEASIGEINKLANVTPSKTYIILDKLKKKGLISSIKKGKITHFQALNPKRIITLIEEKEKKLKNQKKKVQEIIPRLISKKEENKQYSTVYEGYEGMKTLYEEAIEYCHKNKEDFIGFAMSQEEYQNKELMFFFKKYDKLRANLNIKTKLISPLSQKKLRIHNDKNLKFKFIDLELPTGLIIWGNNVAYLNWNDKIIGYVIHSEQIANSNKKFFNNMWDNAK